MRHRTRKLCIGLVLLLAVLLSGCKGGGETGETTAPVETTTTAKTTTAQTTTAENTAPEETTGQTEPDGPVLINPYTGLRLLEGEEWTKRPVAVVINNLKLSLPQSGISQADIIFEIEAEESITRLIVVFSDPAMVGKIGTVRSTRSAFVNVCAGLDAIMFHAGGSPQAYSDIKKLSVQNVDGIYDTTTFYRDQNRMKTAGLEHSMYTTGERIAKKLESMSKAGTRMELASGYKAPFAFYEIDTTPDGGQKCAKITTVYGSSYKPYFTYQESTGLYLRYEYGSAHKDVETDTQLMFKNVIVLSVTSSRIPGDTSFRRQFEDVGSGTGIYATNGVYVPIKWSKASATAPLVLTDMNGNALKLNPGKTFISYVNGMSNLVTE